MIVGVGVDVCEIARFEAALSRQPGLADRLFTLAEQTRDGQRRPVASLAARFAAKEALYKALRPGRGLAWKDCEVITDDAGAPSFSIMGSVAAAADTAGVKTCHLSLSHDGGLAIAYVICEG